MTTSTLTLVELKVGIFRFPLGQAPLDYFMYGEEDGIKYGILLFELPFVWWEGRG